MREQRSEHVERLRKFGIKVTRIRLAILDLLTRDRHHLTADEITAALRARDVAADRVTVYRNVDRMIQDGLLVAIHLPGRAMRVGICTRPEAEHHHHIVCERCGRLEETEGCPIQDVWEDLAHHVREYSGFTLTGHITQYVGICDRCLADGAHPTTSLTRG